MKQLSVVRVLQITCAVAFVLLASAVSSLPPAGSSAHMLVQKLGIYPFPDFKHPIYGWLVYLISAASGPAAYYLINLFSALCATGVLAFTFMLVYRGTRAFNVENSFPDKVMHRVQLGAAILSTLYLLTQHSFWMAATRANPLPFGLLLLLIPLYLALSAEGKGSEPRLFLACTLYGVAMVEYSTAILFLPLFALIVMSRLYQSNNLTVAMLLKAALFGVAGLLLFFLQAGIYTATPAYDWREFKNVGQLFYYMGLDHYKSLTSGVPRVGWLIISMVTLVPFLITISFRIPGGPGRGRGPLIGALIMNFLLAVLGISLLIPGFPLAPDRIVGAGQLYLTPCLLIALWFANVFAFWSVILFRPRRFEEPLLKKARLIAGMAYASIIPMILVASIAVSTIPSTRADRASQRLIQLFVNAVIDRSSQSEWLLSNTPVDDLLALEIKRRESPLKLIRLDYAGHRSSMRYVGSLFQDRPRLKSLSSIGMEPFLEEWVPSETNAAGSITIVNVPDLWLVSGYEALPDRVVFSGVRDPDDAMLSRAFADAQAFWSGEAGAFATAEAQDRFEAFVLNWIRVHISKLANNLGVMLEDAGRDDDAMACYRKAREFFPDNLSALMNMHVLSQRKKWPEYEALEKELVSRTENYAVRVQPASLAQQFGFVRVPELFISRGMTFARTGNMELAISDFRNALKLRRGNSQIELMLAGLYLESNEDLQSKEHYLAVMEKDPSNARALSGLMMIAVRARDYPEARRLLEVRRAIGIPPEKLKIEEAFLEGVSGSAEKGLELMEATVREQPENLLAWAAVAALAAELQLPEKLQAAKSKLDEAGVFIPALQLMLAQAALNARDEDSARAYLNEVLDRMPEHIEALEALLRLELYVGRQRDAVNALVQRTLMIDPRNAIANYALGVEHTSNEEYLLAESAYRASVATRRSPEALNDLAYVLHMQGRNEEAEPLIREAIQIRGSDSVALDTLGVILTELGKLDEAEGALMKARILRPDDASLLLSLALLYEKQGRFEDAEKNARQVNARQNELGAAEQDKIRGLMQRLDRRR